jgi:hypothetical protein
MGITVGGAVPIVCEAFSKAGVVSVAGEAVPVADGAISIAYIAVPVAQYGAFPVADRALFLFLMELSLHLGSYIMFLIKLSVKILSFSSCQKSMSIFLKNFFLTPSCGLFIYCIRRIYTFVRVQALTVIRGHVSVQFKVHIFKTVYLRIY